MVQQGEHQGGSGRVRSGGFSAFAESNLSIVKVEPEEEQLEKVEARLDEPSRALAEHLAGPRAELQAEVKAKLKEYDAASGLRHSHRETRSFVEHYERHTGLRRLRDVIRKFLKKSEIQEAEAEQQPERNPVWKVVGGADGRNLIVRSGPSPNWPKLPDKLGVGSWVEEKEMVQDRIRYTLLWGTGPKTGWVSVMLRDEVLATRMSKMPQSLQSAAEVRKAESLLSITPLKEAQQDELRSFSEKLFGKPADAVGKLAARAEKVETPTAGKDEAALVVAPTVVTAREAAATGEAIPLPPKQCSRERIAVLGLVAAHIQDEASLKRLYQVLQSAWNQEHLEKSAEFVFVLSWFAPEGELSEAVATKLLELREMSGQSGGKSWVDIPQSSPYSHFQHLRAALAQGEQELMQRWQMEPNGAGGYTKQSVWIVFGDDDDLWHGQRVLEYVKQMRSHQSLDAVAAFASLGRVNMVEAGQRSGEFTMPIQASEVDDLLRQGQLYRLDETADCQKALKSLSQAGAACELDVAMDLPTEYFDFCPRLRVFREFVDGASEDLLAHRYCDLAFLKYMRNYPAYGKEMGLEVSYFEPKCWMYFYGNPGSSEEFDRSMMSAPSILLRSVVGAYLSIQSNRTVSTSATAGETEEFLRVANDDGTTSFLSHEGWYLSVGSDGFCYMDGASAGLAEKFDLVDYGSDDAGNTMISLWNVKYTSFLVVDKDGTVKAFHEESEPPGRMFFLELSQKSGVVGEENGHVTATVQLRSGELEFARQECGLFASYSPGLLPEKLARFFAVFRNGIELSLVQFHRTVFDQPELDTLVFQVAHMVFGKIFGRIAQLPVSERSKAARGIYEVCQRFATMLSSELEVKVLWHNSDVFMVPSDQLMKVWLRYRK